jgi:hypothetical protein
MQLLAEDHDLERLVVLAACHRAQQIEDRGEDCRAGRGKQVNTNLTAASGAPTCPIGPQNATASGRRSLDGAGLVEF